MTPDPFNLVGTAIDGKYRIDEMIGEGGFGVVYKGFHEKLDIPIAVKCLKVPSHFTADAKELFLDKFQDEGRHLAKLSEHRSVTRVYDFGVASGLPFLVLEWLEGEDLEQLLETQQTPFTEAAAVEFLRPAIDALAFAHSSGIAHRDIKPANLFWAKTALGEVLKVLDFGIAKAMQDGETATQLSTKTSSGFSAFSPPYGAPEQFRSKKYGATGPWTDVHALGLILTEMVTGQPAFDGEEMGDFFVACIGDQRPTPRHFGAEVSDAFEQLCAKALARSPEERFADASELLDALDNMAAGSPAPRVDTQAQEMAAEVTAVAPKQPVEKQTVEQQTVEQQAAAKQTVAQAPLLEEPKLSAGQQPTTGPVAKPVRSSPGVHKPLVAGLVVVGLAAAGYYLLGHDDSEPEGKLPSGPKPIAVSASPSRSTAPPVANKKLVRLSLMWKQPDNETIWFENGQERDRRPGVFLFAKGQLFQWQLAKREVTLGACACEGSESGCSKKATALDPRFVETNTGAVIPVHQVEPAEEEGLGELSASVVLEATIEQYAFVVSCTDSFGCGAAHPNKQCWWKIFDVGARSKVEPLTSAERTAAGRAEGAQAWAVLKKRDPPPEAKPKISRLVPHYDYAGNLGVEFQFTADACGACSDGMWSSYTNSTLVDARSIPKLLKPLRKLPAELARLGRRDKQRTGWSTSGPVSVQRAKALYAQFSKDRATP